MNSKASISNHLPCFIRQPFPPDSILPDITSKMSSIGPQLPPHLTKRKRTPEDDGQDQPTSPPTKNIRVAPNQDELDVDDSSSDDYGPRAPQPAPGPLVPPSSNNTNEINLDDDSGSESDVGPRPPPPPPKTAGQSLPSVVPTQPAPVSSDDSSDEDDYGPSLPTAATRPQIGPSMPPAPSDDTPQRDSWMLAPPTSSGYTERDPTRIKARKFASKSSSQPAGTQAASIWTETPEEKLQRLHDSVLGRSGPGDAGAGDNLDAARAREEEERNRKIAASVEAKRGKSLMDEHGVKRKQQGAEKEEEDDPSKRAFDREKDMALGGKIGSAKRKELLNKAADFGGRFQKGSYL